MPLAGAALHDWRKQAAVRAAPPCQTFGGDLRLPESGHMFVGLGTAEIRRSRGASATYETTAPVNSGSSAIARSSLKSPGTVPCAN